MGADVSGSKKKKLLGIGAVLVVAIVAAFIINHQMHQGLVDKILRKSNLIIAIQELPSTLNPVLAATETENILMTTLFDGMTNLSGLRIDDYQFALAQDFMQDEGKLNIYTVDLNTDATWHDDPTHKFTAADVLYTYKAILNPENQSPIRGRIEKLIKTIETIDDSTIKIIFRESIAPARVGWVLPFKIIPATYYGKKMGLNLKEDSVAQDFNKSPIGTGPFKFKNWEGNTIAFESTQVETLDLDKVSASTLETESKIRTVTFTVVHDLQKQAKMLMDGKLDLLLDSHPDLHTKLSESGLSKADYIPHYFYSLALNTTKAPFNSAEVRRGIARAIDKVGVVSTVWPETPEKFVNKGPFPHNAVRQYETFKDLNSYDLKSAKKLLRKIKDKEILLIYPENGGSISERMAGKIVQNLNAVGLKVQAKAFGMAFDTQLGNKNYDIALVRHDGFSKGYDITPLVRSNSPQNITGFENPKLDILLRKWQGAAFWVDKLPLSIKVHKELSIQSPYVFLTTLPTRAYYSPRFQEVVLTDPSALLAAVETWTIKK